LAGINLQRIYHSDSLLTIPQGAAGQTAARRES
jgi:hypothetical protein